MIRIPSVESSPGRRLFADSMDPEVFYVDALLPAPVHDSPALRWMPMPDAAYLAGEVRFGPGPEDFRPKLGTPQRLLPMPWEIGTVQAWRREDNTAKILAHGKTSGFGASNTVFSGTAPLSAMVSPILIASELACDAELGLSSTHHRIRVAGNGAADAVADSLRGAELADRASWDATVARALVKMLTGALKSSALNLRIDAEGAEADELREAALLEWAHRIQISLAPDVTLGFPASLIVSTRLQAPVDLELNWVSGTRLKFRATRSLQVNG